jgi:anthranilate phosphoribosyltransferase
VLAGKAGAARDIVLLNSAASLLIAGAASDMHDGLRQAEAALDDGRAAKVLEKLVRASQAAVEGARS